MDVELVVIEPTEPPDDFVVAFDVIYAGETWCRSVVLVDTMVAAAVERERQAVVRMARDALLELLQYEAAPVSFQLRLTAAGTVVLARGSPAGRSRSDRTGGWAGPTG